MNPDSPKMGRFQKSWHLTKGAWHALTLDKEILTFPVMGAALTLFIGATAVLLALTSPQTFFYNFSNDNAVQLTPMGIVGAVLVGLLLTVVSSFVAGAVTHAALERFKGNDPTVKGSFKGAWRRLGSLASFAAFSYTVGYIISAIAERIPFIGGQVAVWLANAAWNVATFFAIPIIVSSDTAIGPVAVTKKSVAVVKQVWGESLIASATVGIITALSVVAYIATSWLLLFGATALSVPGEALVVLGVLLFIGVLALSLVFNVLASFAKAAVYYYATTGEAPLHFDQNMLRQAFTHKKAKKVFGA